MLDITIYSKNSCPNCDAAKHTLHMKGIDFIEHNIDRGPITRESFMAAYPDVKQMPLVIINGQRVGGLAGLQAALTQIGR